MNKKFSKVISMVLVLVMVFSMLGTSAFALTGYYACLNIANAAVELDGTNPGTVSVKLSGAGAMEVYGIEGTWDTTETEASGKLTLTGITSGLMTFSGMNYVDVPSGKVMWSDDTFSAPANVTNGADFLTATYSVAADTPAGTYTVRFCSEVLCASDFNPDTTKTYYTATITVTTNAGGSAPESYYEMLKATDATVDLDGTNPGTATVGVVGTYAMDVYGIEGKWDTAETEGTGKLTLNGITSDLMTFSGMNYVDVPSGKVMWSDDTFSAPANVTNGAKFLTATYTVAADTPAGTYTVRFCSEVLCASDFNPDTTKTYYTATITVTRPADHTCTGVKQTGQSATCTVDGWKDYYACACGKYYADAACTDEIADLAAWKTGAGKIAASHDYGTLVEEDPGVHTATELVNGLKAHYFCDTCDTYFDSSKNPTTEEELTIVNAHDYATEYGYKGEDGHADTCACGAKDTVVGHTPNIPAPTEEDDQVCSECGYVIEPKTGHIHQNNLTPVSKKDAECTVDGYNAYYACSCGKYFEDAMAVVEIPDLDAWKATTGNIPAGHTYGELITAEPEVHTATELKAAVAAHYYCDVCDTYFTEGKVATTLAELTAAAPTHSYTNEYGYVGEDGHANTCSCGAKDTLVQHTHDTAWKSDKNNHWNECACGDKANTDAHVNEDDDMLCDVCGWDLTPAVTPETGDNTSLVLLVSLLVIGCLGVVATVISKKKFSVK